MSADRVAFVTKTSFNYEDALRGHTLPLERYLVVEQPTTSGGGISIASHHLDHLQRPFSGVLRRPWQVVGITILGTVPRSVDRRERIGVVLAWDRAAC